MTAKIFNEKRSERDNERLTESSIEESKRKYDASRVSNIDIKFTGPLNRSAVVIYNLDEYTLIQVNSCNFNTECFL